MDKKWIEITGLQDKRQMIAVLCGSFVGEFLPPQLIHGGKTRQCHPHYNFPADWSNKVTMLLYIWEVIVPFVNGFRQRLDSPVDQPALAIFDHFKGQLQKLSLPGWKKMVFILS